MRQLVLALTLSILPVLPAAAQEWAVGGFDPVSYATQGNAVPGRSDIATMWKGQLWHFASEENRARFESDPRSFAPRFNGFCPISIIEGRPEPGNPRYFMVVNGALYLLRSGADERQLRSDPAGLIAQARAAWRGGD